MAGPAPDEPLSGTITQLAEALGVHRTTISKLIRERGIDPVSTVRGRKRFLVADVLQALRQSQSGETDLDRLSPYERDAMTRSIEREDRIRLRRGELCEMHDHRRSVAAVALACARWCDTLPDRCERAGVPARFVALIEREIDRLRDELAAHIESGQHREDKAA